MYTEFSNYISTHIENGNTTKYISAGILIARN